MHSRVARVLLVALLLAVAAGAALQVRVIAGQARQMADDERALVAQLGRFDATVGDIAAAQGAYVAPGQPDAPWTERVSALLPELTTTLSGIRIRARSATSGSALQAASEAVSALATADAQARDYLSREQELLAADVVFGDGREAAAAARAAAARIAGAEQASFDAARRQHEERLLLLAAGTAAVWVVGLLLLLPRPTRAPAAVPEPAVDLSPATAQPPPTPAGAATPAIDLAEAADLCIALSRVDTAAALPDMLARAAALLDAAGVIVWMGAGDELFAATSHGYNPRVISQLGSIPRSADNATAAAWRAGALRTVPGDSMSNGAIVAPMFSPDACIGVLAAEVRHGREQDLSTQAVTMMVAAQLATVLAAWPAPQTRTAER